MKKLICFLILTLGIIACSSEENKPKEENFEFTAEYSATITVGGFVGIERRTFKVGQTFKGTDQGKEFITIRIAEHTPQNDNCPSNMCYQELLEVPKNYLKLKK
jgi:hypothetical protein